MIPSMPDPWAWSLDAVLSLAGISVAVLGAMLELGSDSAKLHSEIGQYAARLGVDVLVVVGETARPIATGFGAEAVYSETIDVAVGTLLASLQPSDTVLVKASRSIALEKLVAAIAAS